MTTGAGMDTTTGRRAGAYTVNSSAVKFTVVTGAILCLVTQVTAILIFYRMKELHMHAGLLLYVMTVCISLPWLMGIQCYRRTKSELLRAGIDQGVLALVLNSIMRTVGAAYLFLLFSELLILTLLPRG